jgi:hypothetical protein
MISTLDYACCANIPAESLPALADLRWLTDVRAKLDGDRVWVRWPAGDERVVGRLFPLPGSVLFVRREQLWYRLGSRLPSMGLPLEGDMKPLHQLLVPAPVQAVPASADSFQPHVVSLARDDGVRKATGTLCDLNVLGAWASRATSHELAGIRAAHAGTSVMLLGPSLPMLPKAERFWGERLLVPLGYQTRPALPETALLEALGVPGEDLLVLRGAAAALIRGDSLQPLTRAGVRLALKGLA